MLGETRFSELADTVHGPLEGSIMLVQNLISKGSVGCVDPIERLGPEFVIANFVESKTILTSVHNIGWREAN